MKLDKILDISLNIKKIKGLTDNNHIHESLDKIIDVLQEEINLDQKKDKKGMKAIIAANTLHYIGLNNELPWRCREDLRHFKALTADSKLLVGHNTASNLPPLKGREVIIDDRDAKIDLDSIDWCIGGKKTYEKYCHLFTELHVSIIDDDTVGDTLYPFLYNINPDCKYFYYHFFSDKRLLEIYMHGFNDELDSKGKDVFYYKITQTAYDMGRLDAIIGDDVRASDYQTDSQILKRIYEK